MPRGKVNMKIKCTGCGKEYNIPEERLPFGEMVSFPCPACKKIINIDLRSKKKSFITFAGVITFAVVTGRRYSFGSYLSSFV